MSVEVWTYSGDPSNSDLDAVRFLIGDTIETRPLVDDREILWAISEETNIFMSSALVCEHLASLYAREADCSMGGISSKLSAVAKAWTDRAKDLRDRAYSSCEPFFGGLTLSGKEDLDERSDDVQPSFTMKQFDNPDVPEFVDLDYVS